MCLRAMRPALCGSPRELLEDVRGNCAAWCVLYISFQNKALNIHLQWEMERKSASCHEEPSGFIHKEEVPMRHWGRAKSDRLKRVACLCFGVQGASRLLFFHKTHFRHSFICLKGCTCILLRQPKKEEQKGICTDICELVLIVLRI